MADATPNPGLMIPVEPVIINIGGEAVRVYSLYNECIQYILSTMYYYHSYNKLPDNTPPVEKMAPLGAIQITPENYQSILVPGKTEVIIPISNEWVKPSYIEANGGHHKQFKLLYIGQQPFKSFPDETQLTFQYSTLNPGMYVPLKSQYVACRASRLLEYKFPMYYQYSRVESLRISRKVKLFHWRHTITERTEHAIQDVISEGIATDTITARLRDKIRDLVVSEFKRL
jgi:hypothetical protein